MNNRTVIVIDLAARYAAAFGMMAIGRNINTAVVDREQPDYGIKLYGKLDADVEKIEFKHGSQTLTFSGMLTETSGVFAPPLMIDFSKEKNLVETEVNGADNIIVERWGTKEWQLDIKGLLIDMENKVYPQNKIDALHRFFEINDTIEVTGVQFEDKQIDHIYFKDLKITPLEGFQDTVQFTLSASSIQSPLFNVLKP
ncbi:DUF6046 domain-containing protein [Riemerella columbipharyngis]|uniref:DUF6046 domain-containing protein n=1 Tax=Riemerella columbipharyngis TaxID=1071918 RepID=A0A1G7FJ97_9FLAO|nr:DUF6046 domain-containing protein [Riemerella columbipharyngis]SDE75986.1 hypothetical protein SAMN05421544_12325 [Riemerella columbipharyngis]